MLEFNLFLIDYWYFSVPLFFFIFLFAYSEMNKGGKKIEPNELTRLVNKESAILIDIRKKEDYENGHIMTALNYPCLLYTSPSPRDRTRSRMPSSA